MINSGHVGMTYRTVTTHVVESLDGRENARVIVTLDPRGRTL